MRTEVACDHADRPELRRDEYAALVEGACPDCGVPAERTDDGFASCSCCGVAWRIEGSTVLIRLAFVLESDEPGTPSKEDERG